MWCSRNNMSKLIIKSTQSGPQGLLPELRLHQPAENHLIPFIDAGLSSGMVTALSVLAPTAISDVWTD